MLSCIEDNQEYKIDKFSIDSELKKEDNKGLLTLGNRKIILKNNNKFVKFTDDNYDYHFSYSEDFENEFSKRVINSSSKKSLSDYGVKDIYITEETSEYAIYTLETSEGIVYSGIRFDKLDNFTSKSACPLCWVALVIAKVAVELADDDYDSNCKAAIDAAKENCPDGFEVKLSEGGLLGGGTCSVKCK